MAIVGWIIFGLIVGIIGKFLMPGRDPGGYHCDDPPRHRRRVARGLGWSGDRAIRRGGARGVYHGRAGVDSPVVFVSPFRRPACLARL